jgi:lysophospholipase L1-like esterase
MRPSNAVRTVWDAEASGDTSEGVLNRLDEVIGRHPKIVFLMIGGNDLQMGVPVRR